MICFPEAACSGSSSRQTVQVTLFGCQHAPKPKLGPGSGEQQVVYVCAGNLLRCCQDYYFVRRQTVTGLLGFRENIWATQAVRPHSGEL